MTDTVVYKDGNGHFIDTTDLPYWISQGWREGPVPGTSNEPPVTLTTADLAEALTDYAPLAAPTFTGVVTAPEITITGGSPGAGKVLTSDASGSATWQSLPAGNGDATTLAKGVIQLAGDLGGTAASPTVPGLANKAPIASPTFTGTVTTPALKVTGGSPAAGKLLTSDASGNATWAAQAAPSDASTGAKGIVQLAGDLGGTAASPTVPGLASKENTANKGAANGYAPLDSSGLVPAVNLPSYVDDVLEYANLAGFPGTGTTGKIFVALDTGKIYRWSGSAYVEISPSPGSTDSVTEGSTNKYYTDARAQAANSSALALKSPIASPTFTGTVTTPALTVTGGTPAAGKLLTSDASGNATWTAPADATTSAKGVVQLAGILAGSAAAPAFNAAAFGTTSSTACVGNDARLSDTRTPAANTVPCDFTVLVQSGTRATGYGDMPEGIRFDRACTITQVIFHAGTADASGTNTVAIYKGSGGATGSAVTSGSGTLTATTAGATVTVTGSFAFAAGDYFQVNVTALATTPGARLYAHVKGTWN
jgi:hypothetical protein